MRTLIQDAASSPLDSDFRKSFRTIADKVGANEGTVRRRVEALQGTGFLREWWIMVNPEVRGEEQVAVWLDVPADVPRTPLREALALIPGILLVGRFFGTLFTLVLQFRDRASLRKTLELVSRLSGGAVSYAGRVPFPECGIPLSKRDWRILQSLQETPRKSLAQLADDLELSTRTIRRRLQRLIRGQGVFALPGIGPEGLEGGVLACLTVHSSVAEKPEVEARISPKLEPHVWHILHTLPLEPGDGAATVFNLMLPNVTEAKELLRWVRGQQGVDSARVDLYEEIHVVQETLKKLLEAPPGGAVA